MKSKTWTQEMRTTRKSEDNKTQNNTGKRTRNTHDNTGNEKKHKLRPIKQELKIGEQTIRQVTSTGKITKNSKPVTREITQEKPRRDIQYMCRHVLPITRQKQKQIVPPKEDYKQQETMHIQKHSFKLLVATKAPPHNGQLANHTVG